MTRLPKPKATYVRHQGLYIGSVYTAEQMRKFAEKAVLEEREACAQVVEKIETYEKVEKACFKFAAKTIRDRGEQA